MIKKVTLSIIAAFLLLTGISFANEEAAAPASDEATVSEEAAPATDEAVPANADEAAPTGDEAPAEESK